MRDVFARDLKTGEQWLVSAAAGGADGPSEAPVIASRSASIAFSSLASNLVTGDTNRARDVFVVVGRGAPIRVSVASNGSEANGPSFGPDVSEDGRFVVFTSAASNLVSGDTNGLEDVFVRDLAEGTTRRLSARGSVEPDGAARAPAISPDGGWVSFESSATNLVRGDRNRQRDVFLVRRATRELERVSVSSRDREQNADVSAPFAIVSDVSRDGRFVVFDSDATNLARRDLNQDTDVFLRDVRRGRTSLVSRTNSGRQGDNDSYYPRLSASGRFVSFTSFAQNLWPNDPEGEDVFIRDRRLRATSLLTAKANDEPRGPETRRQLLQRPVFSDNGGVAAFTSTAMLTSGDTNGVEDVHVRMTDPPVAQIVRGPRGGPRPRYRLSANRPRAVFLCRIDGRRQYICPRSGRLPRLSRGRHRLSVRAGGAGSRFQGEVAVRTFRVR